MLSYDDHRDDIWFEKKHPRDKCWIAPIPFNRKIFVFMDIRLNHHFIPLRVHFLQLILTRTLPRHRFRNSFFNSAPMTHDWTFDENEPSENSRHIKRDSRIHWFLEYGLKNTSHLSIFRVDSIMLFMCPYPVFNMLWRGLINVSRSL